MAIQDRELNLEKIEKRVREYEVMAHEISSFKGCAENILPQVKEVNPRREGKKLLVLDIDYTLFDHRYALKHHTTTHCTTMCSFTSILIHQHLVQICG